MKININNLIINYLLIERCSVDKMYKNRFASCQSSCSLLAEIVVKNSNDTHASCLQIPSNSGIVSRFPSNPTEINYILGLHNQVRSNVSFPNLNKSITTVYPTATDMRLEFEYLRLKYFLQISTYHN